MKPSPRVLGPVAKDRNRCITAREAEGCHLQKAISVLSMLSALAHRRPAQRTESLCRPPLVIGQFIPSIRNGSLLPLFRQAGRPRRTPSAKVAVMSEIEVGALLLSDGAKIRQEAPLINSALQRAIFSSANFSCIATDAQGVIQLFNVGAERMLGYSASEVIDKITPADISDPQEVIARAKALSLDFSTPISPGFEALAFKAARGIEDIYDLTKVRKDGKQSAERRGRRLKGALIKRLKSREILQLFGSRRMQRYGSSLTDLMREKPTVEGWLFCCLVDIWSQAGRALPCLIQDFPRFGRDTAGSPRMLFAPS